MAQMSDRRWDTEKARVLRAQPGPFSLTRNWHPQQLQPRAAHMQRHWSHSICSDMILTNMPLRWRFKFYLFVA